MTDSHGVPWAGRSLDPAPFAADDGSADPSVLAALRALAATAPPERSAAEQRLLGVLAPSRVLVPLVAAPTESSSSASSDARTAESTGAGLTASTTAAGPKVASMATALLQGPDGTSALPVFTSVAALVAWDPAARPVPTALPDAARSALEEGCAAMPIDLADEHAAVLRASQLWALALGEPWLPAHADPVVRLAVAEAGQGIDGLIRAVAQDGSLHAPGTMRLVLTLRAGLSSYAVDAAVTRIGERLAADPDVRRRIDDLAVVLHQGSDPADAIPPLDPPDLS